ncbi:MAG: hypothetical protein KC483_08560, partial [Nitrosarchaeum sp.]|nr:hypothetical protein [Nitrosarchaeum sp.]
VALLAIVVLVTGTLAGPITLLQPAEALKSKGNNMLETGSKKVCGDRLCSEVPKMTKSEDKKKEQVKAEKKSTEAEKAKNTPKKDEKAETMEKAKTDAAQTTKVARTVTGSMVSATDPGMGHEKHQLAVILPPREKPYSGHLTYDASEPIQLVSLIGPVSPKHLQGQPTWTPDGETVYALVFVDPKKSAGSWVFSGNALAVHTTNETPFTVSYAVVLTE